MKQKLLNPLRLRLCLLVAALLCVGGKAWGVDELSSENKRRQASLVAIMRSQGHDGYQDLPIMNLINHAVLLVYTPRPCFLKSKMFQMFYLAGACARMFLQLNEQISYFLHHGFIAASLDDGELGPGSLGYKDNVSHKLQSVNHLKYVLLTLQSCERGFRTVRGSYVLFHSGDVASVGEEGVARRAIQVRINAIRRLTQLLCQPLTVALRERKTLQIAPQVIQCKCSHNA